MTPSEPGRNSRSARARYTQRVLRRLLAVIRSHPLLVGCVLLGAVAGILRSRGRSRLPAKALGELTPEQQRVIYLRFVANLDPSEIAEIVRTPESVVRRVQLQAFRRLLRLLTDDRS